jgi:ADP-ribose pyrophosphatase YjhB (NUDIX family)
MTLLLRLAYALYQLKGRLLRSVTVGVRIMLIANRRIVLVRHTYHPGWQFPGGGVKWGESLAAAACREAHEEVGACLLRPPTLFGLYHNLGEGKSDHIALFLSEDFVLEQATDHWEIDECQSFALDELPADLGAGYRRRVREYLERDDPYQERW